MKKDKKITLWSERIHEFQSSGQTCKTWCQEHHVPVSTMNYWMRKLKKLDEQSDTDMIFEKMPTEKEISKNETLNISPSPVRIFITNAIRIEVMPECPPEFFHGLLTSRLQRRTNVLKPICLFLILLCHFHFQLSFSARNRLKCFMRMAE